jgi:hypothetical protein
MYAARLIIVFLLIVAVLVAYNPQARQQASQTWESVQPGVVALMDHVYAMVRSVIAGNETHNRTNDPGSPGGNFDRIVTLNSSSSL